MYTHNLACYEYFSLLQGILIFILYVIDNETVCLIDHEYACMHACVYVYTYVCMYIMCVCFYVLL